MQAQDRMRSSEGYVGLPVDREFAFSDHKGVYKKRREKSQTRLLEKASFIRPFLKEGEKVFLVSTGCSPISVVEQLVTGWIVFYLKRSVFVFTDRRIFHVPTTANYSYRNSLAQILYADCASVELKGRKLVVRYKTDRKETFLYMAGAGKKKLKTLLKGLRLEGERSRAGERAHLCPACSEELERGRYVCPVCRLAFKDIATARKVSLMYPGGGYFYTRHLFLGMADAVTEFILTLFVVLSVFQIVNGDWGGVLTAVVFGALLAVEKAVTVYHSNHFIKEYIPVEKEIRTLIKAPLSS